MIVISLLVWAYIVHPLFIIASDHPIFRESGELRQHLPNRRLLPSFMFCPRHADGVAHLSRILFQKGSATVPECNRYGGIEGEESDEGLWEWGCSLEIQGVGAISIQTPKFIYGIDSNLESYPRLN